VVKGIPRKREFGAGRSPEVEQCVCVTQASFGAMHKQGGVVRLEAYSSSWKSPHRYVKSQAIYGIKPLYLPPDSGDFPAKLILDLVTPERCKAELTWHSDIRKSKQVA